MALKKEISSNKIEELYVPNVVWKRTIKEGFFKKSEEIPIQIVSNNAFKTEKEAIHFLPFYVSNLVKSGDLPECVIKKEKDGKSYIDSDILQTGFIKVHVSELDLTNE